jgi:uncharacterized protein
MPLIAVSANDIDIAGLALDVTLPVDWLNGELADAEVTATAAGHLKARLSRSSHDIVVRGRLKAAVSTPCARCLGPTAVDVDAELSLLLRPAGKADAHGHAHAAGSNGAAKKSAKTKEPEYEFSAEEAEVDTYDGETVVLDPFAREAILLEMPNFPLCSEACPGIGRAALGGDRGRDASTPDEGDEEPPGLDPRLAPLSALREKLGQKSPQASDKRPQSASSRPAKSGTPKKTKKE